MAPATITSANVILKNTATGAVIPATVSYAGNVATLTPSSPLSGGVQYTDSVTTGVTDLAGNPLAAPFTSRFTVESTPPTASVSPADGVSNVPTNTTIQVTFSEAMDASTIIPANVSLKNTSTSAVIPTTLSYDAATHIATLTLNPGPLSNATQYTVAVTTGVKDVAGNPMATAINSKFTTAPIPDTIAPTIVTRFPDPVRRTLQSTLL
jgi:hypothetical protein